MSNSSKVVSVRHWGILKGTDCLQFLSEPNCHPTLPAHKDKSSQISACSAVLPLLIKESFSCAGVIDDQKDMPFPQVLSSLLGEEEPILKK